ncbi:MAG: hypothetical protein Q7S63_03220 [bacterium]|nr:hypothetical protein [bacterium]
MRKKTKKSTEKPSSKKKAVVKRPLLGKVTHYYDKIKVAVIRLSAPLKKGDTIEIEGGGKSFKQQVASMEKDHVKIVKAKKRDEVGMKVKRKAREGDRVFKG